MTTDVLFLAHNRREFTKVSFSALLANTNWDLVRRLLVYDDDSIDGTREYLRDRLPLLDCDVSFVEHTLGGPPAVMNTYLHGHDGRTADAFAKIDNDIVAPPGWLDVLLGVFELEPELELLGMEPGRAGRRPEDFAGGYGWIDCSHIGGVGLMRTSAFSDRPPINARGRFGFTEWQHVYEPVRGWVSPDLPVCALDMVPDEPWSSLSAEYVAQGWQRRWPPYDERVSRYLWEDLQAPA